MKAPRVRQLGQQFGGWTVTAPRSWGSSPFGPLERPVWGRRARSRRRFRPHAAGSGFGRARRAVEWWKTARRRSRAEVKWEMSDQYVRPSEQANLREYRERRLSVAEIRDN